MLHKMSVMQPRYRKIKKHFKFSNGKHMGFSGGSRGKESACNAGDPGSIPELERSPEEGDGCPLQDPCLENSMDRGAQRATVHGAAKSWT